MGTHEKTVLLCTNGDIHLFTVTIGIKTKDRANICNFSTRYIFLTELIMPV